MSKTKRSLDHFVTIVGNPDDAAATYRRLGFRVMPTMEHTKIGTANTIVQFLDTYLEFIGDFEHAEHPSIREAYDDWLKHGRDIYAMTSLTSPKLETCRAKLIEEGYAPMEILDASRRVRLPAGGWTQTASRSCYMFNKPNKLTSLFMSDHPKPEAIWIPDWQCHPNTAQRIVKVWYVARDPQADERYHANWFGAPPSIRETGRLSWETPRGERLEVLTPNAMKEAFPEAYELEPDIQGRGAGFTVTVKSLDHCRWALRDGGVAFKERNGALYIHSMQACAMALEFVQAE
jgi:hypothetical protein